MPPQHGARRTITLAVNGRAVEVRVTASRTLLEVLREDLGLTGTKYGCDLGECGACTVLVDDEPRLACLQLAVEADGHRLTTVEGLAVDGTPHPLQAAFVALGAAQCGFCTSGMLMTAKALLDAVPDPSHEAVCEALAGNLCRCTGYVKIIEAVRLAAADARVPGRPEPAEVAR
ncbi:(2Fe-2S)-binding protein [bacterium]|nr:(2Fe-2S)-binding protein [Chloroflexi bacterium CFX6]RIL12458.1 MAG: (2Fe-2S)-binding protein [bacterium]